MERSDVDINQFPTVLAEVTTPILYHEDKQVGGTYVNGIYVKPCHYQLLITRIGKHYPKLWSYLLETEIRSNGVIIAGVPIDAEAWGYSGRCSLPSSLANIVAPLSLQATTTPHEIINHHVIVTWQLSQPESEKLAKSNTIINAQ